MEKVYMTPTEELVIATLSDVAVEGKALYTTII